jgi:putative NADH-flavin reductase
MKVVLFGATGRLGRALLDQALSRGHEVTALVRRAGSLEVVHPQLRCLTGDARDAGAVAGAVEGGEVVISALSGEAQQAGSAAVREVVAAMHLKRVRRGLFVSQGYFAATPGPVVDLVVRPLFLKDAVQEALLSERQVQDSGLDWTLVRPATLTQGPRTGKCKAQVAPPMPVIARFVSRADVAEFLLDEAAQGQFVKRVVTLGARGF